MSAAEASENPAASLPTNWMTGVGEGAAGRAPEIVAGRTTRLILLMNAYTAGISGGDVWCLEVVRRLRGVEPVIITSKLGRMACLGRGPETAAYRLTSTEDRCRRLGFTYLWRTFRALSILRNPWPSGPVVLYASSDFFPDVIPAAVMRLAKRNSIWTQKVYHIAPDHRRLAQLAQRFSHWIICRYADAAIVDNADVRDHLVRSGMDADKAHVCKPGVMLPPPPVPRTGTRAVYVGRVHPAKGIEELLQVWRLVCDRMPEARLALVGHVEDSIRVALHASIDEMGLANNVDVHGFVDDATRTEILNGSNVFMSASSEEGFGIALLEAMACGLPVVAWDIPAFEVFRQVGRLIRRGDHEVFADTVVDIFRDSAMQAHLGSMGRELARLHSWDTTAISEARIMGQAIERRQMLEKIGPHATS